MAKVKTLCGLVEGGPPCAQAAEGARRGASVTCQLVVVDHHQLDVLGLRLDGALTPPHLQGAQQSSADCSQCLSQQRG